MHTIHLLHNAILTSTVRIIYIYVVGYICIILFTVEVNKVIHSISYFTIVEQ